jgi:outer membrane protein assembly factor BamD (BamD/ComL family)
MSFYLKRQWRGLGAAVGVLASVTVIAQSEDLARRTLESGRTFLRSRSYVEAEKDFVSVLERYPTSAFADDALLELAAYQLQVVRDPDAAEARANQLMKTYSTSDSAPMAQVILGRVKLANGSAAEQIGGAVADFDRVARLYPGTEAVPAAMYFGGEAMRLGGNREQAIRRFNELATQFPNSIWTADALLGSAVSLVRAGQPARAIEQLQRIRNRFPNTDEAATALRWNTILYRLYVRAPAQPAYAFSGRMIPASPGKLKDVTDLAIDGDTLLVASKNGVFGYGSKNTQTISVAAPEPRSVVFDRTGKLITVHELGLRSDGKTPISLSLPSVAGKVRAMKLEDAVTTRIGEYLVADAEEKTIFRFARDTKYVSEFTKPIQVRRMAISDVDDVAVLLGDAKSITLFSGAGKMLRQIPEKGTNYQLRNPVDVAFDAFGHLYVMDRSSVLVFSADGSRLITTFSTAEKTPGAIGDAEALALDRSGRLYVMDSRTDSVKVYQ